MLTIPPRLPDPPHQAIEHSPAPAIPPQPGESTQTGIPPPPQTAESAADEAFCAVYEQSDDGVDHWGVWGSPLSWRRE